VNVLQHNSEIGRVVYSKAGRDAGRYYIIASVLNEEYVYICDGDLRKIESPKKKKVKHLSLTDRYIDEVRSNILSGLKVSNSQIKKFLQSEDINKEV
jgi:ribosomal protein L14E/L6E/L27E